MRKLTSRSYYQMASICPNADLGVFAETSKQIEEALGQVGLNCPILFGEPVRRVLMGDQINEFHVAVNPYWGRGRFNKLLNIAVKKDEEQPNRPASQKHINTTLLNIAGEVSRAFGEESIGNYCLRKEHPSFVISRVHHGDIIMNLCFGSSDAYAKLAEPNWKKWLVPLTPYMSAKFMAHRAGTTMNAVAYDISDNRFSYDNLFPKDATDNIERSRKHINFQFEYMLEQVALSEQSRSRGHKKMAELRQLWAQSRRACSGERSESGEVDKEVTVRELKRAP